jgi:hypothetical protein
MVEDEYRSTDFQAAVEKASQLQYFVKYIVAKVILGELTRKQRESRSLTRVHTLPSV